MLPNWNVVAGLVAATLVVSASPLPRLENRPGLVVHAVLERTIFRVDVVALELWLGPATVRELRQHLTMAESAGARALADPCTDPRDSLADPRMAPRTNSRDPRTVPLADALAGAVAGSQDARAQLVFRRAVGLERFLDEVIGDMRRAVRSGLLDAAAFDTVAAGLPVWLAPLRAQDIAAGDRFTYTIAGDTLRTIFQRRGGDVVIDQTDIGPAHRRSLLASFVAPGAGFRDDLLENLRRSAAEPRR
ncbi:MAG: hypothetical protein R6X25_01125 [Candidatus Krumholzibacteriia bacterium]